MNRESLKRFSILVCISLFIGAAARADEGCWEKLNEYYKLDSSAAVSLRQDVLKECDINLHRKNALLQTMLQNCKREGAGATEVVEKCQIDAYRWNQWFEYPGGIDVSGLETASSGTEIHFKNHLSNCMTVEQKGISTLSNLVIVDASISLKKSTGECGCTSASATYTGYVEINGIKDMLQQGQIGVMYSGRRQLTISSDTAMVRNRPVTVELVCTPPL